EDAVIGSVNEDLAELTAVARGLHHVLISPLVGGDHEAVSGRMQRHDREAELAVERDIARQVSDRGGVRGYARRVMQRGQVGAEVPAGTLLEARHFIACRRSRQLAAVIEARVPGGVAAGSRLELGAV